MYIQNYKRPHQKLVFSVICYVRVQVNHGTHDVDWADWSEVAGEEDNPPQS